MSETKVNSDDKTAKLFKRRKRELMRNLGEVEKCNLNPRQAAKNLKMKYILFVYWEINEALKD